MPVDVPPSLKRLFAIVTGEIVENTVPLLVKELPPSLSIVAPNIALEFVIEVAVGLDKTGAAPADVAAEEVGADSVR